MKTSRYSEEQIIGFLNQAEAGMPIKELWRHPVHTHELGSICHQRASLPATNLLGVEKNYTGTPYS
jgi:hypothetical protein